MLDLNVVWGNDFDGRLALITRQSVGSVKPSATIIAWASVHE
jgi:hypothetical protein